MIENEVSDPFFPPFSFIRSQFKPSCCILSSAASRISEINEHVNEMSEIISDLSYQTSEVMLHSSDALLKSIEVTVETFHYRTKKLKVGSKADLNY